MLELTCADVERLIAELDDPPDGIDDPLERDPIGVLPEEEVPIDEVGSEEKPMLEEPEPSAEDDTLEE